MHKVAQGFCICPREAACPCVCLSSRRHLPTVLILCRMHSSGLLSVACRRSPAAVSAPGMRQAKPFFVVMHNNMHRMHKDALGRCIGLHNGYTLAPGMRQAKFFSEQPVKPKL